MSAPRAGEDFSPLLRVAMPGQLLADPGWLSARIDQVARLWGCPERRTNATLWWYSASAVLLAPAVRELVLTGAGVELTPESVRITLRGNGYLEQVIAGPALNAGAAVLGAHLDGALAQVIEPLADISGANERSLWAIAADSLATAVLSATSVLPGGAASASDLAVSIAQAGQRLRPLPRYVEIAVGDAGPAAAGAEPAVRRYVRRGSCCLLVRVPDGKCITCPNQRPADRQARLIRHAGQADLS